MTRVEDDTKLIRLARLDVASLLASLEARICRADEVLLGTKLKPVTVKLQGVAAYDKETATIDGLLRRAEQALLNARQQGCSRVEVGCNLPAAINDDCYQRSHWARDIN